MSDSNLYEDTFTVTAVDTGRYDRVGRIKGTSADNTTVMTLDINTDIYPLGQGDNISLLIASTLNLDGSKDDEERGWREKKGEQTLADMYDYVCHGKVYRFEETNDDEAM
jgi:DNA-directed RNA polymerase I, II, and III subunit RPABC3